MLPTAQKFLADFFLSSATLSVFLLHSLFPEGLQIDVQTSKGWEGESTRGETGIFWEIIHLIMGYQLGKIQLFENYF